MLLLSPEEEIAHMAQVPEALVICLKECTALWSLNPEKCGFQQIVNLCQTVLVIEIPLKGLGSNPSFPLSKLLLIEPLKDT